MPAGSPPKDARPSPRFVSLPAGSFLWRVARRDSSAGPLAGPGWSPFARRTEPLDPVGGEWGGRFDPTPGESYSYCYAALDDLTALCEALLRDVPFYAPRRYLARQSVAGKSLVLLETLEPLWLVSLLDAADLAAAWQDTWLIHAEPPYYSTTQLWARWLRGASGPDGASPPAGMIWPSKRQPTGRAVVLFGDRCEQAVVPAPFGPGLGGRPLDDDDPASQAWLRRRLALLNTQLAPAAVRHA
jgi:RES domain